MTTKQTECVYSKCKNEDIIGSEQVYGCVRIKKQQIDSQ